MLRFFLFLITIFIFLIPNQTIRAERRIESISPSPVTDEATSITIKITSDDPNDNFSTKANYRFQSWKSGSSPGSCAVLAQTQSSLYRTRRAVISSDGKTLTATWKLDRKCQVEVGQWIFAAWTGDEYAVAAPSGTKEYYFVVKPSRDLPSISPGKSEYGINEKPIEVILTNAEEGYNYFFWWNGAKLQMAATGFKDPRSPTSSITLGSLIGTLTEQGTKPTAGTYKLCMEELAQGLVLGSTSPAFMNCTYFTNFVFKDVVTNKEVQCKINPEKPITLSDISLSASNVSPNQTFNIAPSYSTTVLQSNSNTAGTFSLSIGTHLTEGKHSVKVSDASGKEICTVSIPVGGSDPNALGPRDCKPGDNSCVFSSGVSCDPTTGKGGQGGVLTAIGCVPTEPNAMIQGFLKIAGTAGGGIALLLMIFGSFQIITSAGDQHKLQAGREQFSNAVIGLLFIIFSVLLLRIIGVDILGLEGFSRIN